MGETIIQARQILIKEHTLPPLTVAYLPSPTFFADFMKEAGTDEELLTLITTITRIRKKKITHVALYTPNEEFEQRLSPEEMEFYISLRDAGKKLANLTCIPQELRDFS